MQDTHTVSQSMRTVVLAGGVGGARFLDGLRLVSPPPQITAIVNTGDDIEMHGLYISPDVDIVLSTLAGIIHPGQGWGIVDDTDHCMGMMGQLGAQTWFMLGDKDLALHIQRTALRKQGLTVTQITQQYAQALGVDVRVLPMTNSHVETHIHTPAGWIHFQEYLVRERAQPPIHGIAYRGIADAQASDEVWQALRQAEQIIIAPSNPIVSVGTILALSGIREFFAQRRVPVIAISPIVGGNVIKGPLVPMLQHAGYAVSPVGIAQWYHGLIDGMVIDSVDSALADAVAATGVRVCVTDTIMADPARKAALAQRCLDFCAELSQTL